MVCGTNTGIFHWHRLTSESFPGTDALMSISWVVCLSLISICCTMGPLISVTYEYSWLVTSFWLNLHQFCIAEIYHILGILGIQVPSKAGKCDHCFKMVWDYVHVDNIALKIVLGRWVRWMIMLSWVEKSQEAGNVINASLTPKFHRSVKSAFNHGGHWAGRVLRWMVLGPNSWKLWPMPYELEKKN